MRASTVALLALAFPTLAAVAFAQDVLHVDAKTIQQHIDQQAPLVYPPIAKAARVQGAVVLEGSLPKRALSLVREWAGVHHAELTADWELCQTKQLPLKIDPLE